MSQVEFRVSGLLAQPNKQLTLVKEAIHKDIRITFKGKDQVALIGLERSLKLGYVQYFSVQYFQVFSTVFILLSE